MDIFYGILLIALGICIGVITALKISERDIEKIVIYDEEGIPRILDLSDPYIRIGYVAIGIAGPKNWEPKQVRAMVLRIAEALKAEDSKFEVRDNITTEIGEEVENGLCPDCGTPLIKSTVLIAGESIKNLRCPVDSCGWSDLKDKWPFGPSDWGTPYYLGKDKNKTILSNDEHEVKTLPLNGCECRHCEHARELLRKYGNDEDPPSNGVGSGVAESELKKTRDRVVNGGKEE